MPEREGAARYPDQRLTSPWSRLVPQGRRWQPGKHLTSRGRQRAVGSSGCQPQLNGLATMSKTMITVTAAVTQ